MGQLIGSLLDIASRLYQPWAIITDLVRSLLVDERLRPGIHAAPNGRQWDTAAPIVMTLYDLSCRGYDPL